MPRFTWRRMAAAALAALALVLALATAKSLMQSTNNPDVVVVSKQLPAKWALSLMVGLLKRLAVWQASLMPPQLTAINIAGSFLHSKALMVAVKLGLADHLHAGPLHLEELAQRAGARPDYLGRILRALVGIGVFQEPSTGILANNCVSDTLRANRPGSVRDLVLHFTQESYWGAEKMYESVLLEKPDLPAFQLQSGGVEFWDWLDQLQHKELREGFARAMMDASALSNAALLADFDWGRYAGRRVAAIGGGVGGFLAQLLAIYPDLRGVLYDRWAKSMEGDCGPGGQGDLAAAAPGLLDRVEFQAGSFFESAPLADVYFMRYILHDWNDTRAGEILAAVRRAMARSGAAKHAELIIAETVMPTRQPIGSLLGMKDLQMMALLDGKERSRAEFEGLLCGAGFRLHKIVPTRSGLSLILAGLR